MWWLTTFVSTLFEILVTNSQAELSKALRDSYDVAFAPHHPWIVRKGAGLAMRAAPSRDQLAINIKIKDASELKRILN